MTGILRIRNENELEVAVRKNEVLLPISRGGYLLHPRDVFEDLEDGSIYVRYHGLLRPYLMVYAYRNWTRVPECAILSVYPKEEGVFRAFVYPVVRSTGIDFLLDASEQGFEVVRFVLLHYEEPVVREQDLDEMERLEREKE
jgi:hypothetical protein